MRKPAPKAGPTCPNLWQAGSVFYACQLQPKHTGPHLWESAVAPWYRIEWEAAR